MRAAFISARGDRSAQDIADRTEELGCPVTRSVIANFENGRKKSLDVCELMILAAAVGVPPVALLFPTLPDGPVEALPGQEIKAIAALRWFTAEWEAEGSESDAGKVIALSRKRIELERIRSVQQDYLQGEALDTLPDTENAKKLRGLLLEVLGKNEEIDDLNRQIAAIPGAVVTTKKKVGN